MSTVTYDAVLQGVNNRIKYYFCTRKLLFAGLTYTRSNICTVDDSKHAHRLQQTGETAWSEKTSPAIGAAGNSMPVYKEHFTHTASPFKDTPTSNTTPHSSPEKTI